MKFYFSSGYWMKQIFNELLEKLKELMMFRGLHRLFHYIIYIKSEIGFSCGNCACFLCIFKKQNGIIM